MEDQDLHISQTIAADDLAVQGDHMEDQDLHISQTIAADDLAVQGDHIWKIRTYISVKP